MSTVKISALTEKATMDGTEEVLINDSGTSKKFSTQRFLDVKTDCQTAETNASNSAVAAAASAASAASVYDTFDDRYLGTKASDPTTDNDGDALVQGMLYFDSTNNLMKVYDGSSWITTSSATLATLDVYKFTATASQTVFTGTDDDSNTLAIKPTAEIVTMNGIVLEPTTDYTVTETTLTLTTGAALNDEVNVYAFGNFELADHYNKTASDDRYLQDSEVTNLAQVKAFDSADYATAAHNHSGVYEPADATILKDADIGVNVQAYSAVLAGTTASFTTADETKLDGIEASANYITNNNQLTNGAGYVTTDTTYSAGTGLDLSGTTFSIESDLREGGTGSDRYWGNTHDYIFADASHGLRFYTSGSEEMRLENDGDLHVDGDVIAYSTTISDERLKTDINPIEDALSKVEQLTGCTFTYKTDGKESAGLIAQDVEKVLPSAVTEKELPLKTDDDVAYKTVQYDQTIGLLVEAVKELSAKVKELEAK